MFHKYVLFLLSSKHGHHVQYPSHDKINGRRLPFLYESNSFVIHVFTRNWAEVISLADGGLNIQLQTHLSLLINEFA
jgi:hypothetical protein